MSCESALQLLKKVLKPPPRRQPPPRPLRSEEQQNVKRDVDTATWDEGLIKRFLADPATQQYAIDLVGSAGKLLFFTQDPKEVNEIATKTDRILTWLGTPPGFTFIFFAIDAPREISAEEWPSRVSVNGGFATPGSHQIVVYRREEWERVLIHETIHAEGWDWEMPSKPLPCWGLDEDDVIAPHLFEAWTELYAEWLWCGWFDVPWATQREWQEAQALQILARHDLKKSWKENTNVFAYYVLKTALAPHLPFLWVARNGITPEERQHILCELTGPELARLGAAAEHVKPAPMTLRMTVPVTDS